MEITIKTEAAVDMYEAALWNAMNKLMDTKWYEWRKRKYLLWRARNLRKFMWEISDLQTNQTDGSK